MNLFAEYSPAKALVHAEPPRMDLEVRPAREGDLAAIAALAADRNGTSIAEERGRYQEIFARVARGEQRIMLVSACAGEILGYATAAFHHTPSCAPSNAAPTGWYLTGLIVAPHQRRRGVGAHLTSARLGQIGAGTKVYYFANARNRATIDLHAQFGFRERTRDFCYPGVTFQGGCGILFEVDL